MANCHHNSTLSATDKGDKCLCNETKNNIIIGNDNMKSFCINAIDTLVRKISEQQTQIAYLSAELEKLREKKGSKK